MKYSQRINLETSAQIVNLDVHTNSELYCESKMRVKCSTLHQLLPTESLNVTLWLCRAGSCIRQVAPSSVCQSARECCGCEEGGLAARGSGLCRRCRVDCSAAGEKARSPFQPRKDRIYFLLWTSASCCFATMCCVVKIFFFSPFSHTFILIC